MIEYTYLFTVGYTIAIKDKSDYEMPATATSGIMFTIPFKITNKEKLMDAELELRAYMYDILIRKYSANGFELTEFKILSFSLLEDEVNDLDEEFDYMVFFSCIVENIPNSPTFSISDHVIISVPFIIDNEKDFTDARVKSRLELEIYDYLFYKYHVKEMKIKDIKILKFSLLEDEEVD